jgi:hypothetical protein
MAVGLLITMRSNFSWAHFLVYAGLGVAGGLALLGSALELTQGNVCPLAGNIPMCFISLAMSILIGGLFWGITRRTEFE